MTKPSTQISAAQIKAEFERRDMTTMLGAKEAGVSQATFWRWVQGVNPRGAYQRVASDWLKASAKKPGASSLSA